MFLCIEECADYKLLLDLRGEEAALRQVFEIILFFFCIEVFYVHTLVAN